MIDFLEKHQTIKKYLLPILLGVVFILAISGVLFLGRSKDSLYDQEYQRSEKTTDSLVDTSGKQVLEMTVRGNGYTPNVLTAKADEPIVLRAVSNKALGCASLLTIPSLKINKALPINGKTDIEIPAQKSSTTINGTCTMGMYSFKIEVK